MNENIKYTMREELKSAKDGTGFGVGLFFFFLSTILLSLVPGFDVLLKSHHWLYWVIGLLSILVGFLSGSYLKIKEERKLLAYDNDTLKYKYDRYRESKLKSNILFYIILSLIILYFILKPSKETLLSKPENFEAASPTTVITNNSQAESSVPISTNNLEAQLPKFKDYPSDTEYTGSAAELVLDNELAINFRTRLSEALYEKPVFAGEYVMATWGCGTSCTYTAFVNKRTGKVLNEGFGGELGKRLTEVKLDSNLLIAEGAVYDNDGNDTGNYEGYFYLLENEQLTLIKTVSIPRPEQMVKN